MEILSASAAVEARNSLNLSQAKVASDVGISRSYLSQFESGKRILEDRWLVDLKDYFSYQGWSPSEVSSQSEDSAVQGIDKGGLTIADGFVIVELEHEFDVEALLDEYYENGQQIRELREAELKRGFLFKDLDWDRVLKDAYPAILLMARQYQIKQILHGQFEAPDSSVDIHNDKSLITVGNYIDAVLKHTALSNMIELAE